MGIAGSIWPLEHMAQLRELWPTHSAGWIGVKMGKTRSAVIGKANRMGLREKPRYEPKIGLVRRGNGEAQVLTRPARQSQPRGMAEESVIRNIMRERPAATELPPDASECAVSLMRIGEHQCRYPISGVPGPEFMFCGAPVVGEQSWCRRHFRICHAQGY